MREYNLTLTEAADEIQNTKVHRNERGDFALLTEKSIQVAFVVVVNFCTQSYMSCFVGTPCMHSGDARWCPFISPRQAHYSAEMVLEESFVLLLLFRVSGKISSL